MAGAAGNLADFRMDNPAGSLTDISAYCTDVGFPIERDSEESHTFGDTAKEFTVTLPGATLSVSGKWHATLDAVLATHPASGASRTFNYGPAGTTSGNVKYSGECHLDSYEVSGNVDGLIEFTAEFTVTGAVTVGTY